MHLLLIVVHVYSILLAIFARVLHRYTTKIIPNSLYGEGNYK
jgi:hypothetical protein